MPQVELAPDAAAVRLCQYHDTVASTSGAGEITVGATLAAGSKCARCWNYSPLVGAAEPADYPDLCERCTPLIKAAGFKPAVAAAAAGQGGQQAAQKAPKQAAPAVAAA